MNRTRIVTTGLVLSALLGLTDVVSAPLTDGEHPPWVIAIAGGIIGLITLIGVYFGWRGSRVGMATVIVTRLLSALTAVPALFVDDVPSGLRAVAAIGILVTLVAVAMVATGLRRRQVAEAPSYRDEVPSH
jgi:hypothetical protein